MTRLLRARMWLIGGLALVNGVIDGIQPPRSSDFMALTKIGPQIFSSDWANTFSDRWIQVGPLTMAVSGAIEVIHDVTALSRQVLFGPAVYLMFALGIIFVLRRLYRDRGREPHPALELAIGLGTMVTGLGWTGVESGQPMDAVVAVVLVLVARAAVADRPAAAGALLAVAGGIKLTGVLGIPLLLLVPDVRHRVTGAAWAVGGTVVLYAPFFIAGRVETFGFNWRVSSGTLLGLVVEPGTEFTWQMRLAQSVIVIAAGTAATMAWRRRPDVVWLAPLVIAAVRLATDPLVYNYYWLAPEAIALLGIGLLVPRVGLRSGVVMAAGFYTVTFALLVPVMAASLVRFTLTAALIVFALAHPGRTAPDYVEGAAAPV